MSDHKRTVIVEFEVDYETEGRREDGDLALIFHTVEFGFGVTGNERLELCELPDKLRTHIEADAECEHLGELAVAEWDAKHGKRTNSDAGEGK